MPDPLQPRYPGRARRRLERVVREVAVRGSARPWTPRPPDADRRAEAARDYLQAIAGLPWHDHEAAHDAARRFLQRIRPTEP